MEMIFQKLNRTAIFGLIAAALFIIGYFPAFKTLFGQWAKSEDYGHAFLVIPIIGYIVWSKLKAMLAADVRPSNIGLLLLIAATMVYLVAMHAKIDMVASVSMVMTLAATLVYLYGIYSIKVLSTPIILLLLIIPIPSTIYAAASLPLQLKVSQASQYIVSLLNVPAYREGNIITTPDKAFQIVQACSGMRSLMTLVTLSVIIGYFTLKSGYLKTLLVIASLPVAMFVNVIRVVALILFFHFYQVDLSQGVSHTLLGLAVFGISLVALFALQRILFVWERK